MIFIGLGSNLPSETYGTPISVCEKSLELIEKAGVTVQHKSSWYETAPIPVSEQPNFINGVISVETDLNCLDLLEVLQGVETLMGRVRSVINEARIIDLDLLAYNDEIIDSDRLTLPHPRLTERAFVAQPFAEIAPEWHHPISGVSISEILSKLSNQEITRVSA